MKRRRRTVRWLPDQSAFSAFAATLINTPNHVGATSSTNLLYTDGGVPYAFAPGNQFRSEGLNPENLILDHIKGKLSWNIESNNGAEGAADASGIWRYVIRAAIVIQGKVVEPGTTTAVDIQGAGGASVNELDPGATVPISNMGSFVPDGTRILWRRNWLLSVDWEAGAQATGTLVSNEDATPPGPYLDIKPRRLLKSSEVLHGLFQVTSIAGPGAGGTSAVMYGWDVRVAAHNTSRRR